MFVTTHRRIKTKPPGAATDWIVQSETVAGALLVHVVADSVNSIAATARCRIDPRDTS